MTDDDRYIQFYIEDVGTTASRKAREGLEIRLQFDGILGTFPRSDGERLSWYLCECEEEPIARRVRGPEHLSCPVCSRRPGRVHLCTCGVASAIEDGNEEAPCPWCSQVAVAEGHDCRAVDGMDVVVGGACPFCDRTLSASVAGDSNEPVQAEGAAEPSDSGTVPAEERVEADEQPQEPSDLKVAEPELWIAYPSGEGPDPHRDPDPGTDDGPTPRGVEETREPEEAPETASEDRGKLVAVVVGVILIGIIISFFASSGEDPPPAPGQEVEEAAAAASTAADEPDQVAAVPPSGAPSDRPEPDAGTDESPSQDEPAPEETQDTAPVTGELSLSERLAEVSPEDLDESIPPGLDGEIGGSGEDAVVEDAAEALPRGVQVARALDALERDDHEEALVWAETFLAQNPGDPSAQAVLDRALKARGEVAQENRLATWRSGLRGAGSPGLEQYYARRILSEDPDDPPAVRVRAQARREAAERSEEEAEAGNAAAVRAIWDEYQSLWPNDALANVERKRWLEKAAEAAPIEEIASPREEIIAEEAPAPTPEPEPEPEKTTDRQASGPSSAEVRRRTLEQLRPVKIPVPWTFEMGCTRGDPDCTPFETPRHEVKLTRPFRITAFETTTDAYKSCVEHGPCSRPKTPKDRDNPYLPAPYEDPGKGSHPVVYVSWEQATQFCNWLGGRLPTETEWEAAARGLLRGSRFPWTGDLTHERANFAGTGGRDQWEGTNPVGVFEANRYGLYGMAGNVREWVADWRGNYRKTKKRPATDPEGPDSGHLKIIRGGSWRQPVEYLRVSSRDWAGAIGVNDDLGFRCVIPGA